MKALVIAIIVGIAGFMGWMAFQPGCAGSVVASEAECARTAGFDSAFCATIFANPLEAVVKSGNVFTTRDACLKRFTTCDEAPGFKGYAARPAAYCVVRAADGRLASMLPVYRGP